VREEDRDSDCEEEEEEEEDTVVGYRAENDASSVRVREYGESCHSAPHCNPRSHCCRLLRDTLQVTPTEKKRQREEQLQRQ
jgi:hypothetical protein